MEVGLMALEPGSPRSSLESRATALANDAIMWGFQHRMRWHSLTARRTGFMAYPRILRSLPTNKHPPLGLPTGQIA